METLSSSLIISGLFYNEFWESGEVPCAFFVHTSIINKWLIIMNKMFTNSDWEMYEHILQIRRDMFEMRLIIILRATKDQLNFLCDSIKKSQISFPWEENPTLFVDAGRFSIIGKFIKGFNLEAYILNIERKVEPSVYGDQPIDVVSFHQCVRAKLDIINEFQEYTNSQYNLQDKMLFIAFGFPWQQSYFLQKYRLNDDFYSTLPIILSHLETLNYANNLDILDLISLRLAISDVRHPFESNPLIHEIDYMVKRLLVKLTENNHLSIYEYLVAKNSKPLQLLIPYLVYEFQNFFDTLDIDDFGGKSVTLRDTIKLKEEIDVLNKLKERSNVLYSIDGTDFDEMSLSLLVGLIESKNVYGIDLDTNYRWVSNGSIFEPNRFTPAYKTLDIFLRGGNSYNFIEGFTTELKSITFDNNCLIILHIDECNLNDYKIFDNLTVSLVRINHIKIDLNMLENLEQCDIEPRMFLYRSSLENTCRNWQLLNNLAKLSVVEICEDEGTWLSMFEFIWNEIRKSNTNEFRFNSKPKIEIIPQENCYNWIDLNKIKFTIEEQNSKLDIRDVETDEIIDLYCKTWNLYQEEKPYYEFYE